MSVSEIDTERGVLGALLAGADFEAARILEPADFAHPPHRNIWTAMSRVVNSGRPLDHLTISEELLAMGKLEQSGGPAYLMELDQVASIPVNMPTYVEIVRDRSLRRRLIEKATQLSLIASNLSSDPVKIALEGSASLATLGAAGAESFQSLEHGFAELQDELHSIRTGKRVSSLMVGIDVWDLLLKGIQSGILTMIGAYPGVGKSALKNTMIFNLAKLGIPVAVFELEDPRKAMVRRAVAYDSGIPAKRLKSEPLPDFLMYRATRAIEAGYAWAKNIYVDNRRGLTAHQVAATMRQMIIQRGCRAVFIDHANEMKFDMGEDRSDSNISAGVRLIRDVAIEHDVPLVMLQHFSRPKGSNDKDPRFNRPHSALWKNSGGFEETARLAVGLYLDRSKPTGVIASVLKQNEGDKDFDFYLPLHKPSGLIESVGGYPLTDNTTGYHEDDPDETDS